MAHLSSVKNILSYLYYYREGENVKKVYMSKLLYYAALLQQLLNIYF